MKKLLSIAVMALFVAPFFTSCDNDEQIPEPQVVILTERGDTISGDTIKVQIGSSNHTYLEITYLWNDDNRHYPYSIWRQIDDNEVEDLSPKLDDEGFSLPYHDDLGMNEGRFSSEGYGFQKITIRTAFSKNFLHVGSIVKIGARTGEVQSEVYYKVIE